MYQKVGQSSHTCTYFWNMLVKDCLNWKLFGKALGREGIRVNGVHREVLRPKPKWPRTPRDFPRLFHKMSFFLHPKLEKEGFLSAN